RTVEPPRATCPPRCEPGCDGPAWTPPGSLQDPRHGPCVLQGRQEGQRRLCALVAIRTAPLQAVKGPAGVGIPHDDALVVVPAKPICGRGDAVRPPSVAVDGPGPGTGVGKRRHLNGLLVESGTMVAGTTAADGGYREIAARGLAVEQPFQEVQPSAQEGRTPQSGTGRNHCFR